MKHKFLSLLLLCLQSTQLHAGPKTGPKTTQTDKLRLTDLPKELKIGIFAKAIAKSRKNALPLLQLNSQYLPLVQESLQEVPYISKVLQQKKAWLEQAIVASVHGHELKHLQQLIDFEDSLLTRLLTEKEKSLVTTVDWTRHGLATLLAVSVNWETACDAAQDASYQAAGESAYHTAWKAARYVAKNAIKNATGYQLAYYPVKDAIGHATYHAAYHAAWTDMQALHTGTTHYHIAETSSWIVFLDPERQALEQAYHAAYTHPTLLEWEPANEDWFACVQSLEANIAKHFGKSSILGARGPTPMSDEIYQYRYQFVKPLVEHLRRIGTKVWALQNQTRP
ncbi:MAG: hypothetical protein OXT67_09090 [Zetaproteobacteria bacterium]|nr:hypothetical protein [Zetaproteobacteria bacterium]